MYGSVEKDNNFQKILKKKKNHTIQALIDFWLAFEDFESE